MAADATGAQIEAVAEKIRQLGYAPHVIPATTRTVIAVTGNRGPEGKEILEMMPGVIEVMRITPAYRLVSRESKPDPTVIPVAGTRIGGGFTIIAGPCSVENETMIMRTAEQLMRLGVRLMRGGAYKPRTSPYSFQGLGEEGLRLLEKARAKTGIGIVTEVLDEKTADRIEAVADMLQVGTRNMQNYPLLRRLSRSTKPVLLKRGMAATLEEWLMAAEYLVSGGNPHVVLCERGVRTFADHTRSLLDLSAIPVIKRLSHLPIVVDPSHGTGKAEYVPAMSRAALAAGADGLLIEVHPNPREALSDGVQSLDLDAFAALYESLKAVAQALNVPLL